MTSVLFINGSPKGKSGNTSLLFSMLQKLLASKAELKQIQLSEINSWSEAKKDLETAECFIFGTGTYWDSWGSPLQKFLEDISMTEGSSLWLGKPAAVIVLMHSVGGKEVLSRLQGVLNTFGMLIPPMSGLVYSTVNQIALQSKVTDLTDDLWRLDDLEVICHNLLEACAGTRSWNVWPVEQGKFDKVWLK